MVGFGVIRGGGRGHRGRCPFSPLYFGGNVVTSLYRFAGDLKAMERGFTRIYADWLVRKHFTDFPRTNPRNLRKSVKSVFKYTFFSLIFLPCLAPSVGKYSCLSRNSQGFVGDGFIRPEVCTLVNSGRVTSIKIERGNLGTDKSVPYK
ncbi:MAG: hypothetical protein FWG87_00675 [Defluviitaleaceae bacterium]|nr:hypothetical protein [Defluviitaleaceae bacterium]